MRRLGWTLVVALAAVAAQACAKQKLKLEMSREVVAIPPGVQSLEVSPSGAQDTRDHPFKVTVTMRADPELQATFDVRNNDKDRFHSRAMHEAEPGVYAGTFEVQAGERGVLDVVARVLHPPSGALKEIRRDGILSLSASEPPAVAQAPRDDVARECDEQFRALTVHFDFDKHDLRQDEAGRLRAGKAVLEGHPECTIHLHGHTDEIGSEQYNTELSYKRALEVEGFLHGALGIPSERMVIHAHGKSQLLDRSGTEEGKARNRRVEFRALDAG